MSERRRTHKEQGSELRRVLDAIQAEIDQDRPYALATIVGTRGSTYRRAGARLLVRSDGTWEGNLSGGCLEGEVVEVGRRVMATGESELVSYDLTADEEAIWGWGLGCNGAIDVFVEPAVQAVHAVRLLEFGQGSGATDGLLTVVASSVAGVPVGQHAVVADDMTGAGLPRTVLDEARAVLATGRTARRRIDLPEGELDVLVEVRRPPLRLLVCGAGHDAVPLVQFARQLGWEAVVIDDRPSFLTDERFPQASALVHSRPENAASVAGNRERTAVVIMTHNFLRDLDYLRSFLGAHVDYLGILGPSRRLERLLGQLAEQGIRPSADDRSKLHGPAGLDLGAEGPEEIAWAICAEVLAVDRGREGGYLVDREGPIHARAEGNVDEVG